MGAMKFLARFLKISRSYFPSAVVLAAFLLLTVWLVFAYIIDPKYQSSSQLLIGETMATTKNPAAESKHMDLQTIEAYAVFIKSPEVLERVKADMKLDLSISDLQQQIDVGYSSNSPVLTVTVSSGSSRQSVKTANTVSYIFQEEVKNALKADNVSIISQAKETKKVNAHPKNLISRVLAVLGVGFAFSILSSYIIKSAKAADDTKKRNIRKKEDQLQTVFK